MNIFQPIKSEAKPKAEMKLETRNYYVLFVYCNK